METPRPGLSRRSVIAAGAAAGLSAVVLSATALADDRQKSTEQAKEEKRRARADDEPRKWRHIVRPDAQSAADFLNIQPAQGPGEGLFSVRPDGSVDVLWYY